MKDESMPVAPARLADGADPVAEALRAYQASHQDRLDEVLSVKPGFDELWAKHRERAAARTSLRLLAVAASLGAIFVSQQLFSSGFSPFAPIDVSPPITAERNAALQGSSAPDRTPGELSEMQLPTSDNPIEDELAATGVAPSTFRTNLPPPLSEDPRPAGREQKDHKTDGGASAAGNISQKNKNAGVRREDCRSLSERGETEQAFSCYQRQSRGQGIRAELSYLELARIAQTQQGDLVGALRSLEEYEERFPGGTLHPEAVLGKIRLLVKLGRSQEAREAIESAAMHMPEKAGAFRELAVDLAVSEGNCREARLLMKNVPAEQITPAWRAVHLGDCDQDGAAPAPHHRSFPD